MSRRTAPQPIVFRPGAAGATRARSAMAETETLPCRRCGQLAGFAQGDILHVDKSPGGRSWAEYGSCRSRPRRDYLAGGILP
jgi:hypothetical protein